MGDNLEVVFNLGARGIFCLWIAVSYVPFPAESTGRLGRFVPKGFYVKIELELLREVGHGLIFGHNDGREDDLDVGILPGLGIVKRDHGRVVWTHFVDQRNERGGVQKDGGARRLHAHAPLRSLSQASGSGTPAHAFVPASTISRRTALGSAGLSTK